VFTLAAVLVAALAAAGLVAWAPWIKPPVLRPAGLVAGPATGNTITVRWSRPRTGPLPDKYLIISNGAQAGTAAGTATSYRVAGLAPSNSYQNRVVAVRGGKRSPQSALLTTRTLTPPLSAARLQGWWGVRAKPIHHRLVGTICAQEPPVSTSAEPERPLLRVGFFRVPERPGALPDVLGSPIAFEDLERRARKSGCG
jgi:hypothetical protein